MSDHYDRWLNHKRRCVTRLRDDYSASRIYGGTFRSLSDKYIEMRSSLPKGSPGWLTAYLEGYRDALDQENYTNHLVYAYYIDGQFLPINSEAFKALKTEVVCKIHRKHGAHVWREHPQRVYYGYNPEEVNDG